MGYLLVECMQLGDVAEDGVQGGGIEFTLREQWKVIALGRKEKKMWTEIICG